VQLKAYWVGWSQDVERYHRACAPCATYHRGTLKRQGPLQRAPVGEPWERLAIDVTGPHPKSRNGFVYIVTVLDLFTKWAFAVPTRNHEATTVAAVLVDKVFAMFGMPAQLLSDRGPEFEGKLMRELCKAMEIDKLRTTSYKPSTNGAIERFHRSLNTFLAKVIASNQRDWDEWLPPVLAAYHSSVHDSTGFTPNYLMLGREVRLPLDLAYGRPTEDGPGPIMDDFVAARWDRQRESFEQARMHLGVAAERSKRHYDMRVRPMTYRRGDWVWLYSPRRFQGRSPKWQHLYSGPFLVVEVLEPVNLVVQRSSQAALQVVHIDKVKRCHSDVPDSWLPAGGGSQLEAPALEDETDVEEGAPAVDEGSSRVVEGAAGGAENAPLEPVPGSEADRPRRTTRRPARFRRVNGGGRDRPSRIGMIRVRRSEDANDDRPSIRQRNSPDCHIPSLSTVPCKVANLQGQSTWGGSQWTSLPYPTPWASQTSRTSQTSQTSPTYPTFQTWSGESRSSYCYDHDCCNGNCNLLLNVAANSMDNMEDVVYTTFVPKMGWVYGCSLCKLTHPAYFASSPGLVSHALRCHGMVVAGLHVAPQVQIGTYTARAAERCEVERDDESIERYNDKRRLKYQRQQAARSQSGGGSGPRQSRSGSQRGERADGRGERAHSTDTSRGTDRNARAGVSLTATDHHRSAIRKAGRQEEESPALAQAWANLERVLRLEQEQGHGAGSGDRRGGGQGHGAGSGDRRGGGQGHGAGSGDRRGGGQGHGTGGGSQHRGRQGYGTGTGSGRGEGQKETVKTASKGSRSTFPAKGKKSAHGGRTDDDVLSYEAYKRTYCSVDFATSVRLTDIAACKMKPTVEANKGASERDPFANCVMGLEGSSDEDSEPGKGREKDNPGCEKPAKTVTATVTSATQKTAASVVAPIQNRAVGAVPSHGRRKGTDSGSAGKDSTLECKVTGRSTDKTSMPCAADSKGGAKPTDIGGLGPVIDDALGGSSGTPSRGVDLGVDGEELTDFSSLPIDFMSGDDSGSSQPGGSGAAKVSAVTSSSLAAPLFSTTAGVGVSTPKDVARIKKSGDPGRVDPPSAGLKRAAESPPSPPEIVANKKTREGEELTDGKEEDGVRIASASSSTSDVADGPLAAGSKMGAGNQESEDAATCRAMSTIMAASAHLRRLPRPWKKEEIADRLRVIAPMNGPAALLCVVEAAVHVWGDSVGDIELAGLRANPGEAAVAMYAAVAAVQRSV
jgi:Integrase core domain